MANRAFPCRQRLGGSLASTTKYVRNETDNVFTFVDAHRPWRHAKVTDRRTKHDVAECMRALVDVHDPKAERILVGLESLSTHTPSAL